MEFNSSLKLIMILSDGINGHVNQSRGVAYWLSALSNAEVVEADVPSLDKISKLRARFMAKKVSKGSCKPQKFVKNFHIEKFIKKIITTTKEYDIHNGKDEILILSAGSTAAPFNLLLSKILDSPCATIMTPTIIGTKPFDFAIVPEHDYPNFEDNILPTVGSPNFIVRENLKKASDELLTKVPPKSNKIWSVFIGGNDANYKISTKWIDENISKILQRATEENADVYITTSRRTSKEASKSLKKLKEKFSSFHYLLVANEENFNPIPAMLDFSSQIFCTEDSVNMVSETITGGHKVILMRTEYVMGIKYLLQKMTEELVTMDLLSPKFLWGVPRFDRALNGFAEYDHIVKFSSWLNSKERNVEPEKNISFNEAKRAAKWIYSFFV
ncbi:MAG: ELM1/GtrOC1 family putative glycosyltransferase [Synergistaceae bacterium]